jgi:hypothetical protein
MPVPSELVIMVAWQGERSEPRMSAGRYLRVLAARDAKTTHDRLRELAHDVIRPVRLWTARNPNTPPDALIILSTDPDETVRWNVLLNRSTPLEALQAMADEETASAPARWFIVRHKVAHHPHTSAELRSPLLTADVCQPPSTQSCSHERMYWNSRR